MATKKDDYDENELIIIEDLKRVFKRDVFKPRGLFFCLIIDFWLGTLIFGPLIFITFRGSWQCWDYVVVSLFKCGLIQSIMTTVSGCLIMTVIVLSNIYLQDTLKPDPSGKWFTKKQVQIYVNRPCNMSWVVLFKGLLRDCAVKEKFHTLDDYLTRAPLEFEPETLYYFLGQLRWQPEYE